MKNLKYILLLFLTILFINCKNDDNNLDVAFDFTLANLAGTYGVNTYGADLTNTANTQGTDVVISTATIVGDIFQVVLTLNANGTYTATGQYSITTTVRPVSGPPTVTPEILLVDNEGTFTINDSADNRSITFVATKGEFLNGEYLVNFLSEEGITIIQDKTETDGSVTTQTVTTISLLKD